MNEINSEFTEKSEALVPIINKFPELNRLLDNDQGPCIFQHIGKKYELDVLQLTRPEDESKTLVFGVWDVSIEGEIVPTGFCEYTVKPDNSAFVHERNFDLVYDIQEIPERFRNLHDMVPGKYRTIEEGMYVASTQRGTGLSDVFLAQTLVILEAMNVEEVVYKDDTTASKKEIPRRFKSTNTGLIMPETTESFYSKYNMGTTAETFVHEDDAVPTYITKVKTHISAMQESLLHAAFGHYE